MATYYISPTGNDTTGNGTSGNPWATISKAVTSSTTGDTIVCADGTYTFATQTFGSRTITGSDPTSCIFDGADATVRWYFTGVMNISGITFRNATFNGQDSGMFSAAADVYFSRCIFRDLSNGANPYTSIFCLNGSLYRFTGCLFFNLTTIGTRALFNLWFGTGGVDLLSCTFYLSGGSGENFSWFFRERGTWEVNIRSTIIQNAGESMEYQFQETGGPSTHNCSYSDIIGLASAPTGTGVISSDPLFVDPIVGNFSLSPDSPCIDTGVIV